MKNSIKTSIRAVIGIGLAVFLINSILNYSGVDIDTEFQGLSKGVSFFRIFRLWRSSTCAWHFSLEASF